MRERSRNVEDAVSQGMQKGVRTFEQSGKDATARLQARSEGETASREREPSSMERIKNLGSMLTHNIKGLRMLGPTGRKIGKGLLLAYAFGLAAETGAVWQAKQIHQARIEHRLKYYGSPQTGSVADRFARGEITRDEAIDES